MALGISLNYLKVRGFLMFEKFSEKYKNASVKLQAAAENHGEPHWLVQSRLAALASLTAQKLPLLGLAKEISTVLPAEVSFDQRRKLVAQLQQRVKAGKAVRAPLFIQFGQNPIRINLPEELEDQGVILTDIFSAFRLHPRYIQNDFMTKAILPTSSWLSAYHLAWLNAGAFIYIPREVTITQPIDIYLLQDGSQSQAFSSHLLVIAQKNSRCQIRVHLVTKGKTAIPANCMIEVLAKADSRVELAATTKTQAATWLQYRALIAQNAIVNCFASFNSQQATLVEADSILTGEHPTLSQIKLAGLVEKKQRLQIEGEAATGLKLTGQGAIIGDSASLQTNLGKAFSIQHILPEQTANYFDSWCQSIPNLELRQLFEQGDWENIIL